MTFPVRPLLAALTCLVFFVDCSPQGGMPLGPSSPSGVANSARAAAKPKIHALGRRPQTSCPSEYYECVQVSASTPYTAEWCIIYSGTSGCSDLYPGVWTWFPAVATKTGKKTKKVGAFFCPNPGNPSTLTISTTVKKPSNGVAYVVDLTVCNSESSCEGPVKIGVTIVSGSNRTDAASGKRGDDVSTEAVNACGGTFTVPDVKGSFDTGSYLGYPTNSDGAGENADFTSYLTPPAYITSNLAYKALLIKAVLGAIRINFHGTPGFVTFAVNNGDITRFKAPPNWGKTTCTSSATYGEVLFTHPFTTASPIRSNIPLTAAWGFGILDTVISGNASPFDAINNKTPNTFTNGLVNWLVVYCT